MVLFRVVLTLAVIAAFVALWFIVKAEKSEGPQILRFLALIGIFPVLAVMIAVSLPAFRVAMR